MPSYQLERDNKDRFWKKNLNSTLRTAAAQMEGTSEGKVIGWQGKINAVTTTTEE